MLIFKTIDALFIGTRYGVWGMSILGIPLSLILLFCNFTYGLGAILACFAALLVSAALTLLLVPKVVLKNDFLNSKQYILGGLFLIAALCFMGVCVLVSGGLPEMNLLFI